MVKVTGLPVKIRIWDLPNTQQA